MLAFGAGGVEAGEGGGVEGRCALEAEEGAPGRGELRVVRTPGEWVGLRFHVVDGESVEVAVGGVFGRGEHGVGVVVDGGDGGDLFRESGVDLLLGDGKGSEEEEGEQQSHCFSA